MFALDQLTYSQLDIAAELLRETLQFQLLGLLGRIGAVLFGRDLRSVDRRLCTQADPHLLIAARRVVGKVDRENLIPLLVRQAQQTLYAVEFREVFALV